MAKETSVSNSPLGLKYQIAIVGKTNAGKSTLMNVLCKKDISIVSDISGTTTDNVRKSIEIDGIGAAVLIDTAGLSDTSALGNKRLQSTLSAVRNSDLIIYVFDDVNNLSIDNQIETEAADLNIPIIKVLNTGHISSNTHEIITLNAKTGENINILIEEIKSKLPARNSEFTTGLINPFSSIILVMPQDESAPAGRLILPQVMILRELLDKNCTVISTNLKALKNTLDTIKKIDMVVTDSQVFHNVDNIIPKSMPLTSFSILLARNKGDIKYFIDSANTIDNLKPSDSILIAEGCTHAPKEEDIGTVKIPNMLKKINSDIKIDFAKGDDFFKKAKSSKLIIHCGDCMQSSGSFKNKLSFAKNHNVPMTNYGIIIAKCCNILDRVTY